MDASIQGSLDNINRSWKCFTHNGKPMTKEQVVKILSYGVSMGYKYVSEIQENVINDIVNKK